MKKGFILIEVLLAAVIASMIGVALFTSLYQITRFTKVIDNYADVWTKASIAHRQLEKDLLGVFTPIAAEKIEEKKKEAAPGGKEKKEQEAQAPKKEPVKLVTHVFYGVNKEDQLDTLTFITDNPMQVYWGDRAGKAKPRIARVVYRLLKDKDEKNSYTLMRQEGYDFYFDAYKEGGNKDLRQYPMIDGIKKMTVSYGVIDKDEQEEKKESKTQEKKHQKIKYKIIKEWKKEDKGDQKKEEGKEGKKKEIQLPAFVLIKLNLWDQQKKRDVYFEFKIPLIAEGKPVPAPIEQAPQTPPAGAPAMPGAIPAFPVQIPPRPAQGPVGPATIVASAGQTPDTQKDFISPAQFPPAGYSLFTDLETGRIEFINTAQAEQFKPQEVAHAS